MVSQLIVHQKLFIFFSKPKCISYELRNTYSAGHQITYSSLSEVNRIVGGGAVTLYKEITNTKVTFCVTFTTNKVKMENGR